MGCFGSEISGRISNATRFIVKYVVTQSQMQLKGFEFEESKNIGGQISGSMGVQGVGGSINVKGQISTNKKGQVKRISNDSEITVGPNSTTCTGLLIPLSKDDKYFISMWMIRPGQKDILLLKNVRIRSLNQIRKIVWQESGIIKVSDLEAQPEHWRFSNESTRNYPPGHKCPQCKNQVHCYQGCQIYDKYGGVSKDSYGRKNSVVEQQRPAAVAGGYNTGAGKTCPKGHVMNYQTTYGNRNCDRCRSQINTSQGYLHCQRCDYDLDRKCW